HDRAAGELRGEPLDRGGGTADEVVETLAPRRALIGGREPERPSRYPAGEKLLPVEPLPIAEVLLGEFRHHHRLMRLAHGRVDRRGGLNRALELARHPYRVTRQFACERCEDAAVGAIAVEVALAVDAAAVRHRRVPDPPPLRRAHGWRL